MKNTTSDLLMFKVKCLFMRNLVSTITNSMRNLTSENYPVAYTLSQSALAHLNMCLNLKRFKGISLKQGYGLDPFCFDKDLTSKQKVFFRSRIKKPLVSRPKASCALNYEKSNLIVGMIGNLYSTLKEQSILHFKDR